MPIDPDGLSKLTESAESEKGIYETLKHSVRSFSSLTTVPQSSQPTLNSKSRLFNALTYVQALGVKQGQVRGTEVQRYGGVY